MEEMTLKGQGGALPPIDGVPYNRAAQEGQMQTDLVGAASDRVHFEQGMRGEGF